SVSQRTHEMGIRLALGAQPRDVLKLVVKKGMLLAVLGVALGLGGALGLTRAIGGETVSTETQAGPEGSSWLYGVTTTDPTAFICVSFILIALALLACYIPARRATKVDPMVALRYE